MSVLRPYKALLKKLLYDAWIYTSGDDSDDSVTAETIDYHEPKQLLKLPEDEIKKILEHSQFELVVQIMCGMEDDDDQVEHALVKKLDTLFNTIVTSDLSDTQKQLLEQPYRAFILDYDKRISRQRQAEALNGLVVTGRPRRLFGSRQGLCLTLMPNRYWRNVFSQ